VSTVWAIMRPRCGAPPSGPKAAAFPLSSTRRSLNRPTTGPGPPGPRYFPGVPPRAAPWRPLERGLWEAYTGRPARLRHPTRDPPGRHYPIVEGRNHARTGHPQGADSPAHYGVSKRFIFEIMPTAREWGGRAQRVLQAARQVGLFIRYVVVGYREGYPEVSPGGPRHLGLPEPSRLTDRLGFKATGRLKEGSKGAEIMAELAPRSGEPVFTKRRTGAFMHMDLGLTLRARGIQVLSFWGYPPAGWSSPRCGQPRTWTMAQWYWRTAAPTAV